MIDWVAIRAEYVSTPCSQRDLAQKYGVSKSRISARAKLEGWVELRRAQRDAIGAKVEQKTAEAISSEKSDRIVEIVQSAEKAVRLCAQRLDEMEAKHVVKVYEIKVITEVLKNARDIYRSDNKPDTLLEKVSSLLAGIPDCLN